MTDDIVDRLRTEAFFDDDLCTEAADEIERLREYSRLRSLEIIEFGRMVGEAEAEVERLRVVLRKISRERTLWGAMRKAQHALGDFDCAAIAGENSND